MCVFRDFHSGVVMAKREKQLKESELPSVVEIDQEQSTLDDLAGFQTEQSSKTASVRKSTYSL